VRGQHLFDRTEGAAPEFACHRVGSVEIGIDYAHQPDRLALLFQFLIDAGVVASKNAHSYHRDGNRIVSLQEGTLGWPVATLEQQIVNGKLAKSIWNESGYFCDRAIGPLKSFNAPCAPVFLIIQSPRKENLLNPCERLRC
jgi:hypothetical protein